MNLVNVLNTIRDNASYQYQERIPEATQENIEEIQRAMTDPNNAMAVNEFMNTLLNVLIKQVIHNKLFSNPLKALKKGVKPLGDTVEEIYTNFMKAETYDPTGADLLKRKLPDTKTLFHRMNRQDKYKITVGRQQLQKAFASYDRLESYIQSIINTLFNSSELDEFILTKQLIKQALDNNALKVVNVPDPLLSEQNGKAFIKTVKTVSGDMVYPNTNNNAYLDAQDTDDKPITTFSRKSEQILIIDNATEVSVNVDVLASVFNMTVAEFNDTRKITIDAFPDPSIRAALVDEQFMQIYDDLIYFTSFRNEEGLYDNYYLHIWQTLGYSILVNAVCFKVASDEDHDGQIEEFTVSKTLDTGVSLSNKRTKATEGSSYSTKVNGVTEDHKIIVVMGATDISETAVHGNQIAIDTVTNNISITVRKYREYTVTNTLAQGVTNSNDATKAKEDSSYEATLTGVTTETVSITMGGVDITATAYDDGDILIEDVTGNIVITVS